MDLKNGLVLMFVDAKGCERIRVVDMRGLELALSKEELYNWVYKVVF